MQKKFTCAVTGNEFFRNELRRGSEIRKELLEIIQKDLPTFGLDDYISLPSLNDYRRRYVAQVLQEDNRNISALEKNIIESLDKNDILTRNVEPELEKTLTFGEKTSDALSDLMGGWPFTIGFLAFVLLWMGGNTVLLFAKPLDPYPYIFLNLLLSLVASVQAPLIMMSQNRKEARDRRRSVNDYEINLKAELEIKLLHEKVDYLTGVQNHRMLEMHEIQTEYLSDVLKTLEAMKEKSEKAENSGNTREEPPVTEKNETKYKGL